MKCKFDFSVVAMGDPDPGPDRVPHKSCYVRYGSCRLYCQPNVLLQGTPWHKKLGGHVQLLPSS